MFGRTGQVEFNLGGLMRKHGVTIDELKARTGITKKRIREIRAQARVSYMTYCDLTQAVTGRNIFDRAVYESLPSGR